MSGLLAGHVMNDEASQQRYQPSFTDPAAEMAEAAMRLNRTRLARQQQSATIFHPLATGYHNLWPQLAGLDPSQAAIILTSVILQAWKHGSASKVQRRFHRHTTARLGREKCLIALSYTCPSGAILILA